MLEISRNKMMSDTIKDNFSVDEKKANIDALKNGKSPGLDHISAEFVKICKDDLAEIITCALYYIIDKRDFPGVWALGQRTPVFKNGCHKNPNNYRGITILPIFAKIFETAVNRRIMFANDAFSIVDRFKGGFLKGSRTSDDIFILHGLVQRQLCLGKPLFICFVDFSKAFDLVNRHNLFFKLIKSGFHGRVFDTLRSLYKKTNFRVQIGGKLNSLIKDELGVNQARHYLENTQKNVVYHPFAIKYRVSSLSQSISTYHVVWGKSTSANACNAKLFNWFLRCTLGVKSSTSKLVIAGECGQIPPSVFVHMNILCYDARLKGLPEPCIVKQVYNELLWFHQLSYTCTRASADLRFTQLLKRCDWI